MHTSIFLSTVHTVSEELVLYLGIFIFFTSNLFYYIMKNRMGHIFFYSFIFLQHLFDTYSYKEAASRVIFHM